MFNFSSPETSLQLLLDAMRADGDGPGVANEPVDEQSIETLRESLAYAYSAIKIARRDYGEEVAMAAKAGYDEIWMTLIESDDEFRRRVIEMKVRFPFEKKAYIAFARGRTSEL